jgi:hypothetical protein
MGSRIAAIGVAGLAAILCAGCVEDSASKGALKDAQTRQKKAEGEAKANSDAVAKANATIKEANAIIKQLRQENSELKAALANKPSSTAKAPTSEADEPPPVELVTRESYLKLTNQMEYSQVAGILGPGKELSSSAIRRTVQWRNYNGKVRIVVEFQNVGVSERVDVLMSKSIYD